MCKPSAGVCQLLASIHPEIASVHNVCMCVCVPALKGIHVNGPCMTSRTSSNNFW